MWRGRILACGRRSWMWEDRILLCNGNITSVCSGAHRMSMWSIRHCLWEYAGGQLEAGLAANVNLTGCPCGGKALQKFSQLLPRLVSHHPGSQICSHCQKPTRKCWLKRLPHMRRSCSDEIGDSTTGSIGFTIENARDVFSACTMQWQGRYRHREELVTAHRLGNWVEKFLKMCNR